MFTKNSACPKLKNKKQTKPPFPFNSHEKKDICFFPDLLKLLRIDFSWFQYWGLNSSPFETGKHSATELHNSLLPVHPHTLFFVWRLMGIKGSY